MPQWEYYTMHLKAEAQYELPFLETLRDWKEGIPQFTPEALIPRLNAMGEQGWELIRIEPVIVGSKADVLVSGERTWTNTYFCVFKRQKSG